MHKNAVRKKHEERVKVRKGEGSARTTFEIAKFSIVPTNVVVFQYVTGNGGNIL